MILSGEKQNSPNCDTSRCDVGAKLALHWGTANQQKCRWLDDGKGIRVLVSQIDVKTKNNKWIMILEKRVLEHFDMELWFCSSLNRQPDN